MYFDVHDQEGRQAPQCARRAVRPDNRKVVNSVWESRDGVSFKKLFTFKTDQQASAIARTDAGFFVGIGWRFTTRWNLACKDGCSGNAGDDVSGSIYKIP